MLLILILGDLAVWARLNLCIKDLIILHVRLDAAISIDKSDKYTFYTPSITLKEHSAIFKINYNFRNYSNFVLQLSFKKLL